MMSTILAVFAGIFIALAAWELVTLSLVTVTRFSANVVLRMTDSPFMQHERSDERKRAEVALEKMSAYNPLRAQIKVLAKLAIAILLVCLI